MSTENAELDQLQSAYKGAVETWIKAIREEEALASGDHSVAEIDQWEIAAQKQQEAGEEVKTAKSNYEDALRKKFFNF